MRPLIVSMDRITKNPYRLYYLLSFCYVILSIILGFMLKNELVIFLGWNMVLAIFVLVLAQLAHSIIEKKKSKGYILSLLLIWILFFPNSFYMLTDFIHFQNYQYFINYPDVYAFNLADWLVFFHIVVGALVALKVGILSVDHLIIYIKKHQFIYLSILFLASSFGIYLGRFIRLNSWDIFKIHIIIGQVFDRFGFMISFIGLFFLIHWLSYILFKE